LKGTEYIAHIYREVIRRNPGESEFHQAVKEVILNTPGLITEDHA